MLRALLLDGGGGVGGGGGGGRIKGRAILGFLFGSLKCCECVDGWDGRSSPDLELIVRSRWSSAS